MSEAYDEYLKVHKQGVKNAFYFLRDNLPQIFGSGENSILGEVEHNIVYGHDASKSDPIEYEAYDNYFYGNRSYDVVNKFNYAWLHHIHNNPHHWQYWVLINDDPNNGEKILDMPDVYIIEMICDWWSFSWKQGNLDEIFKWYDEHKNYMKLSDYTKIKVTNILTLIKEKLQEPMDIQGSIEGYVDEIIEE